MSATLGLAFLVVAFLCWVLGRIHGRRQTQRRFEEAAHRHLRAARPWDEHG